MLRLIAPMVRRIVNQALAIAFLWDFLIEESDWAQTAKLTSSESFNDPA